MHSRPKKSVDLDCRFKCEKHYSNKRKIFV